MSQGIRVEKPASIGLLRHARQRFFLWPVLPLICLLSGCIPWLTANAAPLHIIQDVRFRSAATETRIVIEVDRAVPYQIGRLTHPNRLYIDLPKTRLAPDWERQRVKVDDERLHLIRIAQHQANQVRIVLDLKILGDFRIFALLRPYRIIIDLRGRAATARHNSQTPKAAPPALDSPRLTRSRRPTIVIDPGHGGKDPGAVGRHGLQEKTVVLHIAKALRDIFRQAVPHYRIILTRDRDVFVPLVRRARLANQHKAVLFISIHANASKNQKANGIETWYLSFAANDQAKRTAARENQMSVAQLSDLEIILRDLQETDRINQSSILANTIQTALVRHLGKRYRGIRNRGIDGAPFVVLLHTSMPSVLVETAFISNSRDARRLRRRSYQRALAQGIFQGVRWFLRTSHLTNRQSEGG